ncbi:unnamed protein product [Paramecium sonneborni]|uniref:Uncharacterized protein n=1 Tax=Paramecium sonneborni TaxID=65129 RepID=A0A8S1R273_9CILI|nr:unnamed protein product [Paramecium sonneborni]
MDAQCVYQDWIRFEALILQDYLNRGRIKQFKIQHTFISSKEHIEIDCIRIKHKCYIMFKYSKRDGFYKYCQTFISMCFIQQIRFLCGKQKAQQIKEILPHFEKQQPLQILESPYNKKEEYFFIVSQFQELLFLAQNIKEFRIDCFLHTINCFEYYCYLLIHNDLYSQIKQLQFELPSYENNFENLVIAHHYITKQHKIFKFKNLSNLLLLLKRNIGELNTMFLNL